MTHCFRLVLTPCLLWSALAFGECTVTSVPHRTALLELYTSEGCSSCPPADRWLSRLKMQETATHAVIPLALHVDYWDRLGWRDRFADPIFSERQRQQAALQNARLVYTPQVMLNGRDYRGWHRANQFTQDIAAIRRQPALADLSLTSSWSARELTIEANAQSSQHPDAVMFLAVYENNLISTVKAGENSGAKLHHDYVVRAWRGPFPIGRSLVEKIARPSEWKTDDIGVVAFVQRPTNGEILQSLAMTPCRH